MKLLVTGAAGFIGANFVHYILKETDLDVIGLDSLTYASNLKSLEGLDPHRFEFVQGDIEDFELLDVIVPNVDAVVNFAAESHNDNSLKDPLPFVRTNIMGTYSVLESVRKHKKRLHHISTDEVFGDLPLHGTEQFDEDTPYRPSSPYSATKAGSDLLVRAWVRSFGVMATISNCSNNYGPFQHVEKFIPRQVTNLIVGKSPVVYGDGSNVRDWIHVDDHSSAILRILEKGLIGETYLIGANGERTNREVMGSILKAFSKDESEIHFVPDRPGHDLRYAINSQKLKRELGWEPVFNSFEDGLEATINWYRENSDWWLATKSQTEARYQAVERSSE